MNAKHTPTPWSFEPDSDNEVIYPRRSRTRLSFTSDDILGSIKSAKTEGALPFHVARIWADLIGGEDEARANAVFIVHCVNSHATLVAALEDALPFVEANSDGGVSHRTALANIRAALKEAKGEA